MKYLLMIFFAFGLFAGEEKSFNGTLKVRLQDDYTYSFIVKLKDGTKVSIARKEHDIDLKKYLEKEVVLYGVLRTKTQEQPNDFIRRVTTILIQKTQVELNADSAKVVTNI